jgi:glutathione synthase/RimK-type ligase-like ATP-grasp enzyme
VILAISHEGDSHAPLVLDALQRAGHEAVLLDLAELPRNGAVHAPAGGAPGRREIRVRGQAPISLDEVRCVWWRRPRPFEALGGLAPRDAGFAVRQTAEAVLGLFASLNARWVNDPVRDDVANRKTLQHRVAEQEGLLVPPTVVGNDPADVRAFLDSLGGQPAIHKPLFGAEHGGRPTRFVRADHLPSLQAVRIAPLIFQAYVPGVDVRVTAVGDELFACAIDARACATPEDCRTALHDPACRLSSCAVPDGVAAGLRGVVRGLGLLYAAADFRIRADGAWVFLEVNPSGQWYWVEERTGLPITAALVDLLARG